MTLSYTPPNADWLGAGRTATGTVQVAAVDLDTRPVSLLAQRACTLFRIRTATVSAVPSSLPADGLSQATVEVTVEDYLGDPVPDGTEVGISVQPVFVTASAGGTILEGVLKTGDDRIHIFQTMDRRFGFTYRAPEDRGPGYAVVQVITVDSEGAATGLANKTNITLTTP